MDERITVPASAAMVPVVHRAVLGLLPGSPDAARVASELASNAVARAEGDLTVRIQVDGGDVRIEVSDQRGRHPRAAVPDVDPDPLGLVSDLAAHVGGRRTRSGDGLTWAVVPLPDTPAAHPAAEEE